MTAGCFVITSRNKRRLRLLNNEITFIAPVRGPRLAVSRLPDFQSAKLLDLLSISSSFPKTSSKQ